MVNHDGINYIITTSQDRHLLSCLGVRKFQKWFFENILSMISSIYQEWVSECCECVIWKEEEEEEDFVELSTSLHTQSGDDDIRSSEKFTHQHRFKYIFNEFILLAMIRNYHTFNF